MAYHFCFDYCIYTLFMSLFLIGILLRYIIYFLLLLWYFKNCLYTRMFHRVYPNNNLFSKYFNFINVLNGLKAMIFYIYLLYRLEYKFRCFLISTYLSNTIMFLNIVICQKLKFRLFLNYYSYFFLSKFLILLFFFWFLKFKIYF